MSKKYFTLEEANQLLPIVRSELRSLQFVKNQLELKLNHLTRRKERRHQINRPIRKNAFFMMECQIEFLQIEAQMYIKSLTDKGVQIKDINLGLLDFPALIDGEEVLLCWKSGEEEITHYHRLNEGYIGRKPIQK